MVYLHMVASEFGIKRHDSVKAAYDSIEAAQAQAEHNIARNTQRPLRIVDEDGNVLINYEDAQ